MALTNRQKKLIRDDVERLRPVYKYWADLMRMYNRQGVSLHVDTLRGLTNAHRLERSAHLDCDEYYESINDATVADLLRDSRNIPSSPAGIYRTEREKRASHRMQAKAEIENLVMPVQLAPIDDTYGRGIGTRVCIDGKSARGIAQVVYWGGGRLRFNMATRKIEASIRRDEWHTLSDNGEDFLYDIMLHPGYVCLDGRMREVAARYTPAEWKRSLNTLKTAPWKALVKEYRPEGYEAENPFVKKLFAYTDWLNDPRVRITEMWHQIDYPRMLETIEDFKREIDYATRFEKRHRTIQGIRYIVPTDSFIAEIKERRTADDN